MPGIRPAAFLSSYFFPGKGMREWTLDRRPGKWIVNEKLPPRKCRGAKQIVIPMTQQQYDDIWQDADRVRSFIEQSPGRLRSCFRRASTKAIACTALGVSL